MTVAFAQRDPQDLVVGAASVTVAVVERTVGYRHAQAAPRLELHTLLKCGLRALT